VTDLPLRPGSLVHLRYGCFHAKVVLGARGDYRPMLTAPDGTLVDDGRLLVPDGSYRDFPVAYNLGLGGVLTFAVRLLHGGPRPWLVDADIAPLAPLNPLREEVIDEQVRPEAPAASRRDREDPPVAVRPGVRHDPGVVHADPHGHHLGVGRVAGGWTGPDRSNPWMSSGKDHAEAAPG
jgi:hypothetical protein